MRKEKQDMLRIEKNLQTQLEKSQSLVRHLEVEVESLKAKVRLLEERLEGAELVTSATQTSEEAGSGVEADWTKDIAEEVRDIASSTMEQQGLVLEETSGEILIDKLKYPLTSPLDTQDCTTTTGPGTTLMLREDCTMMGTTGSGTSMITTRSSTKSTVRSLHMK